MRATPPLLVLAALSMLGCGPSRRPTEAQRARPDGAVVFTDMAARHLGVSAADTFPELRADALPRPVIDSVAAFHARAGGDARCTRYAAVAELYVAIAQLSCGPIDDGQALAAWTADGTLSTKLRGRGTQVGFVPRYRDSTGQAWTAPDGKR